MQATVVDLRYRMNLLNKDNASIPQSLRRYEHNRQK